MKKFSFSLLIACSIMSLENVTAKEPQETPTVEEHKDEPQSTTSSNVSKNTPQQTQSASQCPQAGKKPNQAYACPNSGTFPCVDGAQECVGITFCKLGEYCYLDPGSPPAPCACCYCGPITGPDAPPPPPPYFSSIGPIDCNYNASICQGYIEGCADGKGGGVCGPNSPQPNIPCCPPKGEDGRSSNESCNDWCQAKIYNSCMEQLGCGGDAALKKKERG